MAVAASTPIELIENVYANLDENIALGREKLGRGIDLGRQVLINHLASADQDLDRGVSYVDLRPDRSYARRHSTNGLVAIHDGWFR